MTINIPQNTYQSPTTINPEMVELICKVFIRGDEYKATSCNIIAADYCIDTYSVKYPRFYNGYRSGIGEKHEERKFNGAEMNAAFNALIQAGYYMFKIYDNGVVYKCKRVPYDNDGWQRVYSFDTQID